MSAVKIVKTQTARLNAVAERAIFCKAIKGIANAIVSFYLSRRKQQSCFGITSPNVFA